MVDESGFFFVSSVKETWGMGTPERIGGSLTGWSEVWLVERDGKFRVLKSLKPNYRKLPLYEGLLKKEFDLGYSLTHSNICQTPCRTSVCGLPSIRQQKKNCMSAW